jgi:hypothetical protein
MPLLKPSIIVYLYTWAIGFEYYTKEISYRPGTLSYEDTEIKAIEMITKPLSRDHTFYPISVSGIANLEYCNQTLKSFGFTKTATHQITPAEDRILNRVFWTSYSLGVDYETEPTRHEEDPFGVF